MTGSFRVTIGLGWLLALAGCTHVPTQPQPSRRDEGQVSYHAQPSGGAGMAHYQLAMGQTAIQPRIQQKVAPVYPPQLVALHLPPQDIPAQLAVNGDGQVYHLIVQGEATADGQRKAFIDAVRAAVLQWRFTPLVIQHMAADADGNMHVVDQTRPPFSEFYVFHFELKNGIPMGTGTATGAPRQP
ncbi:hypothetical protein ACYJW8_10450 [Frateuria aurantia]